jgi:hypothetical protein
MMTWTDRIQVTYLRGPSPVPEITATLWWILGTVGTKGFTFIPVEEHPVTGDKVTFVAEPPAVTRSVALSLHETGWPGPLFRSLASQNLPTPEPEDPDGFVDVFIPETLDITDVAALYQGDSSVRHLRDRGGDVSVALGPGSITVTGTGRARTNPFPAVTMTETFSLGPVGEVGTVPVPFRGRSVEVLSQGSTSSGPVSDSDVPSGVGGAVQAIAQGIEDEMYLLAARSLAQFRSPAPAVPAPPPTTGVTVSARRIAIGSTVIRVWPAIGSFGDLSVRIFGPRPSDGGRTCALRQHALLAAMALDLQLLRTYRDRVLAASADGSSLVSGYYRHGAEFVRLLNADPGLAAACADALQAVASDLANGHSPGRNTLARAEFLLVRLRSVASLPLRRDLDAITAAGGLAAILPSN